MCHLPLLYLRNPVLLRLSRQVFFAAGFLAGTGLDVLSTLFCATAAAFVVDFVVALVVDFVTDFPVDFADAAEGLFAAGLRAAGRRGFAGVAGITGDTAGASVFVLPGIGGILGNISLSIALLTACLN